MTIDQAFLLAQLRAILARTPDFSTFSARSSLHHEWLAAAYAAVSVHNHLEGSSIKTWWGMLDSHALRASAVANILAPIHRAVAELDMAVGARPGGVYGPGAVYDFGRGIRELLSSAKSEVFCVDPYLDAAAFDGYVAGAPAAAALKVLVGRKPKPGLASAMAAFSTQHPSRLVALKSPNVHDRILFIDRTTCFIVGQSLKDGARSAPTYVAPLPADLAPLKLAEYDRVWAAAAPL